MIRWAEGEIRGPGAEKYREIPQRGTWTSSCWVTKRGYAVYRRHYDLVTGHWRWSDQATPWVLDDESGRLGVYLTSWTSREMVIALAWRHRAVDSPARVVTLRDGDVQAQWIRWREEEDGVEDGAIQGETFKPLRWRCGNVPCPKGYFISSQGRLKAPSGDVTAGFWVQGLETRMASVRGCGLVDLFVAAKIKPNTMHLPPSLKRAVDCILSGNGPQELADATGLSLTTSFGYLTKVAVHLRSSDLKRHVPRIVSDELWRTLTRMRDERDPLFGGTLTALQPALGQCVFRFPDQKMSELRLARMAIAAGT